MLDFDLTDEQRLLEQSVREWGAREVAPRIRELDRQHRFDPAILPQMAELGLLGCSVPPEYGGAGMDYVSLGIISEELEYVDTSLRVIMSVHAGLNCLSLLTWGTEDQKQRYLVPQAQGKKLATYGLTEPAAGSDVRGIQTVAVKKGDRYFLTGEKMWISLADVADNFLVFAWSDLEKKKQRDTSGISAFIVERQFKGFSSGTLKEKWGILAGNTGFFKMEEVEVPEANLVGKPGRGLQDRDVRARPGPLHRGRRRDRPDPRVPRRQRQVRAASAKTFGVKIAEHQLVKEMIAQMESDYQAARLLWLRAGLPEEPRPPQHARDRPGEVVRDRCLGARRRRRGPGARGQRLLRRVSRRPLLPQLQGRRHLRGHARDTQADAGRLRARLPGRQADAVPAAQSRMKDAFPGNSRVWLETARALAAVGEAPTQTEK